MFDFSKYRQPLMDASGAGTGGSGAGGAGTVTAEDAKRAIDRYAEQATNKRVLGTINNIFQEANKILTKTGDLMLQRIKDFGGEAYMNIHQAQVNTARAMGMSYEASSNLFDTYSALNKTGMGAIFGMNQQKLFETQKNIGKITGRNIQISEETGWNIGAMNTLIGEEAATDLIGKLDVFGQNATDAAEYVGEMYKTAGKYGLSFEEYSNNFKNNLEKAQMYTFKDGLKGLSNMAKKATEIKLTFETVSKTAEKMWGEGVEGAIDAASKLQVLGGPFSALADPLAMLNEGLNNMEGLQTRIADMVGNMGKFNRENGEIEVAGINKMRLRAAAPALGLSADELMKTVYAQARRNEIGQELGFYSGLKDEIREKLMNIGTFEKGIAGANIRGNFYNVDQIAASEELQRELLMEGVSQEESVRNIAQSVRSIEEQLKSLQLGQDGGIAAQMKRMFDDVAVVINSLTGVVTNTKVNAAGAFTNAAVGTMEVGKIIFNGGGAIKSGNGGPVPRFGDGGLVSGPSHAEGGIMASIHNVPAVNLEGGEFIVNKESASQYGNVLKTINNANKPYSDMPSPSGLYGNGGYLATVPQANFNIGGIIGGSISPLTYSITPIQTENQQISSTERNMTYEKVAYNNVNNNTTNNAGGNSMPSELKVGGEIILNIKGDGGRSTSEKVNFVDLWGKMSQAEKLSIAHEILKQQIHTGVG